MLSQIVRTRSVKYVWEHSFQPLAVIHLWPSWPRFLEKRMVISFKIYSHNSPSFTCFAGYNASQNLQDIYLSSLLPLPIPILSTLLTQLLFRSFLFNFHVLRFSYCVFFFFFCNWFIAWFHYGEKHSLNDFNCFKFAEVCFLAQDIVCLGECSIGIWKKGCIQLMVLECSV